MRPYLKPVLIAGLIAIGMGIGFYTARYYDRAGSPGRIEGFFWPHLKQIYPFVTVDQYRKTFNLDRLKGKWSFIYFGYTHCPDICPVTLAILSRVYIHLTQLEPDAKIQVLFVTADPERDKPEQLEKYVTYFNKHFIGLGGTPAQVQSLAVQLGAVAETQTNGNGDYQVNHSASVFLTDPGARLVTVYATPHDARSIEERFLKIKDFIERQVKS